MITCTNEWLIFVTNDDRSESYVIKYQETPYTHRRGNQIYIDTGGQNPPSVRLKTAFGFEVDKVMSMKQYQLEGVFSIYPPDWSDHEMIYDEMLVCAKMIEKYLKGESDFDIEGIKGYYLL